jgi:hypothetical protein
MSFYEKYSEALETIWCQLWIPDQESYLPGRSHELAQASGRAMRAWWDTGTHARCHWPPMVLLAVNLWVHAVNVLWLVRESTLEVAREAKGSP